MKREINKITLILRGYTTEQCLLIAKEANKYNCFNLEITTNSPNWLDSIREIINARLNNIVVGAGTVLDMKLLIQAIEAGSQFVLAPIMMTKEMLDYCNEKSVVSVPAAFSPSEIFSMKRQGADIVKLFPAIDLPVRYIKDIIAPLGDLSIMVVGGINGMNVSNYFMNGAMYAGIGSGICDKDELIKGNTKSLEENLKKLSQIVNGL